MRFNANFLAAKEGVASNFLIGSKQGSVAAGPGANCPQSTSLGKVDITKEVTPCKLFERKICL